MTTDKIRYFVGTDPNGCDAESLMVLDYSMRQHTDREVEIVWMRHSNDVGSFWHGWDGHLWPTPFSGFRWAIPEYCGFEGQAIYSDSDVIWLDDIAKLWDRPFEAGKLVQAKGGKEGWRFCVCKWNNPECQQFPLRVGRMRTVADSHERMKGLLAGNPHVVQPFDIDWNNVDGENLTEFSGVGALHYSSMNHQPHLKYALPRLERQGIKHWFDGDIQRHWNEAVIDLFDEYYNKALEAGYKVKDYEPESLYGDYKKLSQANYNKSGHVAHGWIK